MGTVTIEINGQKVTAREGDKLLWAALDAGLYIPHLCAGREIDYHPGSCRLCFVEIKGRAEPALACQETIAPNMVVSTESERVDRLVRTGFELLMSTHRLDCKDCPANKKCALQEIAKQRKIPLKPKRLPKIEPDWPIDDSHPQFGLNPNHCVLCGKCVHVCNTIENCRILDFSKRGALTSISTFDHAPLAQHDCSSCLCCVEVCPVGALYRK
jgi:formate dehydrogenase major subunit/NADH-quinone oxidoreductase subunit G